MAGRVQARIGAAEAGLRLDQALSRLVPELSRTRAKALLSEGAVFLDQKRVKVAGRLVREGQRLSVTLRESLPRPSEALRQAPLEVVAQTDDYVVVAKSSGMFSAPTPESDRGDVLDLLRRRLRSEGQDEEVFLVHRLDRPTSGLMVVARTSAAAAHLSAQVSSHAARREYLALVAVTETSGWVSTLGGSARGVALPLDGRDALTHFEVEEECAGLARLRARLETGRTHQVRRHALSLGCPIVGDSQYGRAALRAWFRERPVGAPAKAPRLALHATVLQFADPRTNSLVRFDCPMPPELLGFWQAWAAAAPK